MNQDKWIQQLHDKLAEHEMAAPEGLWADIEAALPRQPKPRKARFVALRRWAVAASFAALALGGSYLWWNRQAGPLMSVADDVAEEKEAESTEHVTDPHSDDADVTIPEKIAKPLVQKELAQVMPQEADNRSEEETVPEAPSPIAKEAAEPVAKTHHDMTTDDGSLPVSETTVIKSTKNRLPLTFGLYAMNGFGNQSSRQGVLMADDMARQFQQTYANSFTASARSSEPIYLAGFEERQYHHRPVSYGLTVSYPLTERLSLTTGVVYTKLVSDFTQVMRSLQVQQQQTLHYVGVPVAVSYRLWSQKGFKAYISAGNQIYWNVATHVVSEGVTQDMEKDRLQWSLNGSVGAQYDILPQLGLYVEPGLSYYPDNGSRLQNYFKDKPLDMSLQVGLRINFNR